jgi:CheY-like chemotaxis protein
MEVRMNATLARLGNRRTRRGSRGPGTRIVVDLLMPDGVQFTRTVARRTTIPRKTEKPMTPEPTPVVLVADDEPSMLALVAQHLKKMGYEVLEASDGEQAWSLAEEQLPDLVVLDVMMPGMSGWEVCRKIREHVALAHTAIVMLTGIGENLNELTSPLYGADSYIDKPFDFAELDAKVRLALAKRTSMGRGLPGLARTEPGHDARPSPAADELDTPVLPPPPRSPAMARPAEKPKAAKPKAKPQAKPKKKVAAKAKPKPKKKVAAKPKKKAKPAKPRPRKGRRR